jgi:membrane-bound lytic murein transglycosylase F
MNKFIYAGLSVVLAISFFALGRMSGSACVPEVKIAKPSLLSKIKTNKVLNVAILNAPSTYYIILESI